MFGEAGQLWQLALHHRQGDKRSAALAPLYHTRSVKLGQSLSNRRATDAEALLQLSLCGKRVARLQLRVRDEALDRLTHGTVQR